MTKSGKERILKLLKKHKRGMDKKTLILMTGHINVGQRISELRREGHNIVTEMHDGENRYGQKTRYGVYRLRG